MSAEDGSLNRFWYIVARSPDLKSLPLERKIGGRSIVLFRGEQGQAVALDATCPHRGANLARGRVVNGAIVCPYHGWCFDGAGRCTQIPSEPQGRAIPAGYVTQGFAVQEQQGLIWLCLSQKAFTPPPRFASLDDRKLHPFFHEEIVPVPFDWWIENALDITHVPYVHRSTYGGQNPVVASYKVSRRADELGFEAQAQINQQYSLLARLLHRTTGHAETRIRVTLEMPGSVVFDIDLGGGKRQVLIFLSTPEDGANTRIWVAVLRNYLLVPGGDLIGRHFLRAVIREDVKMAKSALCLSTLSMRQPFSVAADEPSLEFLRLLKIWRSRKLEIAHERA